MAIFILIVFLLYSFITTCSYAFYEFFSAKNKVGGIITLLISIAGVILPVMGLLL